MVFTGLYPVLAENYENLKPALEKLARHKWKGNIRELADSLEYAMTLCHGERILADDLPESSSAASRLQFAADSDSVWDPRQPKTLREVEMDVIHRVLDKHQGDKPRAASELGIALKTLYNKLNQYEVRAAG